MIGKIARLYVAVLFVALVGTIVLWHWIGPEALGLIQGAAIGAVIGSIVTFMLFGRKK